MGLEHSFRALGRQEMPPTLLVEARPYRLVREFKHTFVVAVGVYENAGDRVVCKCYRRARFFGLPLAGLGRLAARYEAAVLSRLDGLEGVPGLRSTQEASIVARDYVPGRPLVKREPMDGEFFRRLSDLLDRIHERGVAYVDLEKANNILVGDDGRPYLIDFGIAFYVPRRLLGETSLFRAVRRHFQRSDRYHLLKHFRRSCPHLFTPAQKARAKQKPWIVRISNVLFAPWKGLRRRMLGK